MADSAFAAMVDRYKSLTDVPDLYTFDAPVSADSAQVYPSYTVVIDEGLSCSYEFELTVLEVTQLIFMVYANTLALVDAAVEKIKYNGGEIGERLGLDFGILPTLNIDYTNLEVKRESERRFAAIPTGKNAQRIHGCEMRYRVSLYRTETGN
jgi:hypothetical protein